MTFTPSAFPTETPRMLPIKHLSLVPKAVPSPGEPIEITLLPVVMLAPASTTNSDVSGTRGSVGKRVLAHGCIAAAGNDKAGFLAHNRVVVAGGVERERSLTDGRVIVARYVASERIGAGGRVLVAVDVGLERTFPCRGIIDAGSVLVERFMTDGRVKAGSGVAETANAPLAVS